MAPASGWPHKKTEANKPTSYQGILSILEPIAEQHGASLADVIVLSGNVGVEDASGIDVPFLAGRGDANKAQTDADSFAVLEPLADGFRNYQKVDFTTSPEEMLLDKAQLLGLTAPEMTVLVGGLRSVGISSSGDGVWSSAGQRQMTGSKLCLT